MASIDRLIQLDDARLRYVNHRLKQVHSTLHLLQEEHHSLRAESAKLVANIAAKRVRYSPVRQLLPEICDIIFAFCTYAECGVDCLFGDNNNFDCTPPVVLTHVCKRWRYLVVNNPGLWTRIHVRPMTMDIFRARLWFVRSAKMPLRVTICSKHLHDKGWDLRSISSVVPQLIRQFIPYLDRIQSFHSHMGMEVLPQLFPAGKVIQMPLAEELSLLIDDNRNDDALIGLLHAPQIHTLHVRDITPLAEVLGGVLPLVRNLVVDHCRPWKFSRSFPSMLASCAQLQTCIISFPNNLFFADIEAIELPELLSLSVEWPFRFEPSPIFRALRAPKLQSLSVSHLAPHLILPRHTLRSLRGLVQSAATSLKSLTFIGCNLLTQDESAALLGDCSALEYLAIVNCQHGDRLLVPLTPPSPPPAQQQHCNNAAHNMSARDAWMCPRLTHVAISGLQDTDVRPIVNFARSRCDAMQEQTNSVPHLSSSASAPWHASQMPQRGDTGSAEHAYLKELKLDVNIYTLTRHARILMLSGLLGVHRVLNIVGPFGELFSAST